MVLGVTLNHVHSDFGYVVIVVLDTVMVVLGGLV